MYTSNPTWNLILRELYTNPLARDQDIVDNIYVHRGTMMYMLDRLEPHGTFKRVTLFHRLGYIKVKTRHLKKSMPERYQRILRLWVDAPYMSAPDMERELGLSRTTINNYICKIYEYHGFTPVHRPTMARLEYFYWMTWFDKDRLARDAIKQYQLVTAQ